MSVPAVKSAQRREREKIAAWARDRTADPATIFLDTETTGLGRDAEIIDLGVVDSHGNVLIDSLIAPRLPIPPETTRVHGIVDADVIGAPNWIDIYPILAALLRDRPVVVYNADFDRRMIAGCCTSFGIEGETAEWHCAMRQYAAWAGVRSSHKRQRYRLHKLSDALAAFDLPPGGHRALSDALACRRLIEALAASEF
jgi:DNA polymerase-3 subunit epsilon